MSSSGAAPVTMPLLNKFTLYKRRWLILAGFSLVSMTNEIIWISLSSITSIVKKYYRVNSIAVNWLSMIYFVLFGFVVISSYVLDRFGLRFTILIGAILNMLGSSIRCFGTKRDGFVYIFLGSTVAACAQCFLMIIPARLAAVWFGEHERATASAIGVLMNMSGIAVGFMMGTVVPNSSSIDYAVESGISTLLITQAVICSCLVLFAVVVVQEAPPTPPSQSQELLSRLQDKSLMRNILKGKVRWTRLCMGNIKDYGIKEVHKIQTNHSAEDISSESAILEQSFIIRKKPNFKESVLILVKDKSFHLLCQAYSIYFGLNSAYNVILNEMVTAKYPGKEKEVGYLGCAANLLGVVAMFFSGVSLDRTKRYKSLSILVFMICASTMLVFTTVLRYHDNFAIMFLCFCIYGLFSYPHMSAGLEHAAEITYPVPEGTTSGILLLFGSIYGVILTYVIGATIKKGSPEMAGYLMVILYVIGLALVLLNNSPLKRSEADKQRRIDYSKF